MIDARRAARCARASLLTAVMAAAVSAQAWITQAWAADAASGEKLAQRWCASCHVVSDGQQRANADVPSFASISSRPGFDAAQVALFLLTPHPRMPDMNLSRAEAADLAAFIASRKK